MKTTHTFTATIIGFICGLAILWIATNNIDSVPTKSQAFIPTPKETTTNNSDLELYRDEVSYLQQDLKSLQKQLNDLQQATQQNQAENTELEHESQES